MADSQFEALLERYRALLAIDRDSLDEALAGQPELFATVADHFAQATAERDAVKLDLDEAMAEHGLRLRKEAEDKKAKLTEGGLEQQLAMLKVIKGLQTQLLDAKAMVARWAALKDAFEQRNYMLRELVPMYLSRIYSTTSVSAPRADLADVNRKLAGQERIRRRVGAPARSAET